MISYRCTRYTRVRNTFSQSVALRTGCRILVLHRELIEGKRALDVWKFGEKKVCKI